LNYLLDTNILVAYSRSANLANALEAELQLFGGNHNLAISAVTIGELNSLTYRNNYGKKRKSEMEQFVNKLFKININIREILDLYGQIDAFSQGKFSEKTSPFTARNMGKNDIWIAATASAYDMTLITTDKDFNHLNEEFLEVKYVDLSEFSY